MVGIQDSNAVGTKRAGWLSAMAVAMAGSGLVAPAAAQAQTAEQVQKPFHEIDLNNLDFGLELPEWTDAQIRERFRDARDRRFLDNPCDFGGIPLPGCDPSFARRLPWAWHQGGCEVRAYYMNEMAEDAGMRDLPLKVFAFPTPETWGSSDHPGQLHMRSKYHENGRSDEYIAWEYHVASIVRSSTTGTVYVLDPAINPDSPTPWQFWAHSMVDDLDHLNIAFGQPDAYDEGSLVVGGSGANVEARANSDLQLRLMGEWIFHVTEGSGDPNDMLGDEPPWYQEEVYYPVSYYPYAISACATCIWSSEALTPRCIQDCP